MILYVICSILQNVRSVIYEFQEMRVRYCTFMLGILLFLGQTTCAKKAQKQRLHKPPPEIWMQIFIHGTLMVPSCFTYKTFFQLIKGRAYGTFQHKLVSYVRSDPFFYQEQCMQGLGLRPIVEGKSPLAATIFASLCDRIAHEDSTVSRKNVRNFYYTYGWSGLLSTHARYDAARTLYHQLYSEYRSLCRKYPRSKVKIRIMGYSHGGTVGLRLAEFFNAKKHTLKVDELVLVSMPIHEPTAGLVGSDLFGKVYTFYSRADTHQRLDCFSFKRFSRRRFPQEIMDAYSHKLIQIEIKINSYARNCTKKYCHTCVDRSPGHCEMWFFGWTQRNYRPYFPLYPLPAALFLPKIIDIVEKYRNQEADLVVSFAPDSPVAHMWRRHSFGKKQKIDFLETHFLQDLKEKALLKMPKPFSGALYDQRIQWAAQRATRECLYD